MSKGGTPPILLYVIMRWVAIDGAYDAMGNIRFLQMGDVLIRELDGQRCRGIVQIFCFRCADDGGCCALCPLPCQRNLLYSNTDRQSAAKAWVG